MSGKEKALELLGTGKTVSGAELARELGVSRNAVWKVMNGLRQSGYEIEAVTNRGYRLISVPDLLSAAEITRRLPPAQKEIFRRSFTFTSGGTSALFVRWIVEDFATPVESLAKSLAYYYNGVFNGHKFARKK